MKELQKYSVVTLYKLGNINLEYPVVYLASEADAAFAEMRRENEGLRKQVNDFIAIERQMIADSEAAKLEYKRDADELIAKHAEEIARYKDELESLRAMTREMVYMVNKAKGHAEEIERLKAERDARPNFSNEQLNMLLKGHRETNQWLSDKVEELETQAERYEKLRSLNVPQFQRLYMRNIHGEGRFDELVDQLPASGEASEEEQHGRVE